jgi:DNA polymerase-3 subunit epsilon
MTIIIDRPLVFFDLETTGLDPKTDSIVEVAAIKLYPEDSIEKKEWLIKPRTPIPAEIEKLTGITNEMVAGQGFFSSVVEEIDQFFGCGAFDIGGHNVVRFDGPFMVEEFRRAGKDFALEGRKVVDTQKIYHRFEGRHLADAVRLYCGREHEDAHRAMADAQATVDVLRGQIQYYKWPTPITVDELAKLSDDHDPDKWVDRDRKFFWRDGKAVFNFGKYRSKTIEEVFRIDSSYFRWLAAPERDFGKEVRAICQNAIRGQFPIKGAMVND